MFSSTPSHRPSSSMSVRSSYTPNGYVNPTFQSSIFSHLDVNTSNSTNFDSHSELKMAAKKRVNRVERHSQVLPTVNEWAPKSTDVNNPDAHKDTEVNAIAVAKRKAELEAAKMKEHKEKLNSVLKEELKKIEEKHQTRLDHKKPNQDAREEYRQAETEYWSQTKEVLGKVKEEKNDYAKDLAEQMEKKAKIRQSEVEKQKNDLRTGLDLKPRKEYNMQEYKDTLKKQMEEKMQKESEQKKAKQNERQERLNELKSHEKMVEHYKQQINLKRAQSALYTATAPSESDAGSVKSVNPREQLKRQVTTPIGQAKTDWEAASLSLIRKNEEQEEHLQSIKSQIEVKNAKKEQEISKKKQEERAITGFNLANHKAKITVHQVAEGLKAQMKEKEQVKQKEVEVKKAEVVAKKEERKAGERVAWQQYEEYCQKKMELFDRYKKDYSSYAPIKKNKGLMTVKI